MSKTYTKRTNAKRAAIAAGIPADEVEIVAVKEAGKPARFTYRQKATEATVRAAGVAKRNAATKAPAAERERRNGVARPRAGGLCAAVWAWLDKHPEATLADVRAAAGKQGWNVNNACIELYMWRKFNASTEAAVS